MRECLSDWVNYLIREQLHEWVSRQMDKGLSKWMSEWMSGWSYEKMNEWMWRNKCLSEWMSDCMNTLTRGWLNDLNEWTSDSGPHPWSGERGPAAREEGVMFSAGSPPLPLQQQNPASSQTTGDCSIMYGYKQDCHVSFTPPPELHRTIETQMSVKERISGGLSTCLPHCWEITSSSQLS